MNASLGLTVALALFLATTGLARAEPLAQPEERPILTISGKISSTNRPGRARFDRAMLERLGMVSFETSTP